MVDSREKSVVELGKECILKIILFLFSDIVIMSLISQNTNSFIHSFIYFFHKVT